MAEYTTIEVTKEHRKWFQDTAADFGMDGRTFSRRLFGWLAAQDRKFLQAMVGSVLQEDREWYMRKVLEQLLSQTTPPANYPIKVIDTPPEPNPDGSAPRQRRSADRAPADQGHTGE